MLSKNTVKKLGLLADSMGSTMSPLDAAITNQQKMLKSMASYKSTKAFPSLKGMSDSDCGLYYNWVSNITKQGFSFSNILFPGYGFLSTLQQDAMINAGINTIANEMTREWGCLESLEDDDDKEKVTDLEKEFERLNVKDVFREAARKSALFVA